MTTASLKSALPASCLITLLGLGLFSAQLRAQPQAPQPQAALPAPAVFPVPPQGFDQGREGVEKGKLEKVEYDSSTIGQKRWMEVYTPAGYSTDKKYPILLLLHGIGGNETREWTAQGHATVVLDNLIADKKIVPMIVVFPNGNASTNSEGRTGVGNEGGPARMAGARPGGSNAPAGGTNVAAAPGGAPRGAGRGGRGGGMGEGWGKNFENDLFKDIIPFLDSHYSTIPDAAHRALAGLSMGGMQTRSINLSNIGKFSYVGIFSGGNIKPEDISDLDAFKKQVKLVFMSYGSRESTAPRGDRPGPGGSEGARIATEALNKAGIRAIQYTSPDSAHDFTSWKRSLYYFTPELFRD